MFVFWVKNGKILWGIGIPGAGKTVLASIVIRYLEGLENTLGGVICVAYVYLRYSEPLSIRDILESLVKQIVERHDDLIPIIEAIYARHKKEGTKPSQEELREVLEGFVRHGKTLFFVLDALDEMKTDDRPILLRLLASLGAKLFITSRPLEPLQQQFANAQVFNIAASPSDLDLHIKNFLRHSPEVMALLEGTDLEEQIVATIHQKSGGMFLHVKLQLEALRTCVSALDVEETLQAFPSDIEAIYAKTWERILAQAPKQSNLAKLTFLWITHANGEMTIDTLRRAVATSPETYAFEPKRMVPEALLLSVCCGLVSVDEKTRLVRLIHYTTQDAILPRILDLFPVPHALLGQVCIVHVTKCGFQRYADAWGTEVDLEGLLHNDTLLAYAYRSWVHHTRQCGRYTPITSAAANLVLNCTSYPLDDEWAVDFGGPLHVAAFYGLEDLVPLAVQVHSPNSGTTNLRESPLMLAAQHGHLACAKALLSLPGIDVNLCNPSSQNALMIAAFYGRIECVQLLADVPNIDVNALAVDDISGQTALMYAVEAGHTGIVKLFVTLPGTNINAVDLDGWTALAYAVGEGHTEIVKELLGAQGIDVNRASFRTKETALTVAASRGQINIVKQLLDVPRIDVNAVSESGKTALSCALAEGHREIVDLLLAFPGIIVPTSINLL
ncbi:ankyrin repeat domain-containing protein 28 [Coprinopsis sp. MPI-PUGE-AT-0042]|nr:ankyrin repeat domain-containing protein 28 [Coprinopsis sp. MPI-PUGE-AT-0042]